MLHILTRSPFEVNMILLVNFLKSDDDIVVLQDGVIIAINGNVILNKFLSIPVKIYVLKNDINARGIQKKISNKVYVINYSEFVLLTIKHNKQMSW
ncbi:MAG: sulfurtransferase complex subunit TusB [Buchnera aphidicola (Nurudea shiraii)]